jgi:hypothetical protein
MKSNVIMIESPEGKAMELATLIELRREAERREKELKDYFKELIGEAEATVQIGAYILVLSECTRTDLDKKALMVAMGDRIKDFEKQTSYTKLEVKKA